MKTKMEVTMTVPKELLELVHTDKWLVRDHLEPAMRKTVPIIKAAFLRHLPDGRASGTRDLQTEKSRERFPNHMKDHLGSKQIKDPGGVLQIVGVTNKAAHVRLDHGDKARKGEGRKHVLWGHFKADRTQPPAYRRQMYDIRERVRDEVQSRCFFIVIDALTKAIRKQLRAER